MSETPTVDAVPPSAPESQQTESTSSVAANGDATSQPPHLSTAELKKRRAQAKAVDSTPKAQSGAPKEGQKQHRDTKQVSKDDKARPLPIRRRPSQSNVPAVKEPEKKPKKESKQAGLFFGHLYSQPKQQSMSGASKDVHPAILALGLQYSSYAICGSTARMVAMLLAFKAVIGDYQTPPGISLARHLTNHHLSPQIEFLKGCRPLSVSMGNAIRWLKDRKFQPERAFAQRTVYPCKLCSSKQ
jgi:translation initiation factor eIF-2B subunit delta